jgi:hypothetical protein
MSKTIDMTPTWAAIAPVIAAALEDGTEAGKDAARTELRRMAQLADRTNELAEALDAIIAEWEGTDADFPALKQARAALAKLPIR